MNKKIMSVLITASIAASLVAAPVHADAENQMKVSAPKYYRVVATKDADGYDAFEEVETDAEGNFTNVVSWENDSRVVGTVTGTFKAEVDVTDGSGKSAALYGAVYDEENKLVSVAGDKKATADASDKLSITANVDENQKFKSFVWDGAITPVSIQDKAPTISYFYCDDPGTVTIAWYDEGGNYSLYKNGVQVDISGITATGAGSYSNMSKYPAFIYNDASAVTGDKYVVKNNDVASDELVADFADGAYITMGKYVTGRNMSYMRNDNAQWWHETVSEHKNIEGRECDVSAYKTYEAGGATKQKWTSFFFKLDQDFISGSGNTVDVTIDYFDAGEGSLRIKHIPDSNTSAESEVFTVANIENTKTWKTATYRLTNASFLADTHLDGESQIRIMTATGSAIARVSVTPYINTNVATLRAANTYTDGIELRWTMESASAVTGYTIKRDGETIATNYQKRTYYDRNLAADTEYTYTVTAETAKGLGTESAALTAKTQKTQFVSIDLPLVDGYEKNTSATSNFEASTATQYDGGNGITFGLYTNDRWNEGMTLARQRDGKWGRTTICRNTGSGTGWYEVYTYASGAKRGSSFLSFQVDNSIISADTRDLTVEFDYFDYGDSELNGQRVELTYLAYNNGGTPAKKTVGVVGYGRDGKWKTAKVVLNDAQFDHSAGVIQGGYNYDFRLGSSVNRGGLTVSAVRVYANGAIAMPEHEISAEVNADGTALEGTLPMDIWGSYDRDIGFSGTDGMETVDGKHYLYNREYVGGGWRQWMNSFCYKIPDDFLYGTDYTDVKIAVEYYIPSDDAGMYINVKKLDGEEDLKIWAANPKHQWATQVFEFKSGEVPFSNGYDGADFRFLFNGRGYIHKVTIYKDIIED